MAVAMIGPKFYAWDRNGKPLAFGKLYTYQARTNTPKPTYQSEDQVVENTNPVILNGEGYANVYLDGSYKMVLKDSDDNEIWSSDPVTSAQPDEWVNCFTASYVSPTSFKIPGNQTDEYRVDRKVRIDNNTSEYSYSSIKSSSYASGETSIVVFDAVVTTGVQNVCTSITSSESGFSKSDLGGYTDYVAENSSDMVEGKTINGDTVVLSLNQQWSTGGTTYRLTTLSIPVVLDDFKVVSESVVGVEYPKDCQDTSKTPDKFYIGAEKYQISESLIPDGSEIAGGNLVIEGANKELSIVEVEESVPAALNFRDNSVFSDFTLQSDNTEINGSTTQVGFRTTDTGLSAYGGWKSAKARGFRIGAFIRNSVNSFIEKVNWRSNGAHVFLARAPLAADNSNPESPAGWNNPDGTGFFNNIFGITDSNFSFGEVGVFGTALCLGVRNSSMQAQHETVGGNTILPTGEVGTCIYLQAGAEGSNRGSAAHVYENVYSEASDRFIRAKDVRSLKLSHCFYQGKASGAEAKVFDFDNVTAKIEGFVSYDYCKPSTAINNTVATISPESSFGIGGNPTVDATSVLYLRGDADLDSESFNKSIPAGSSGKTYRTNTKVLDSNFADLRIVSLTDGSTRQTWHAEIYRYTNTVDVVWVGNDPSATRFTLSVDSNDYVNITMVTNLGFNLFGTMVVKGENNSSTPQELIEVI